MGRLSSKTPMNNAHMNKFLFWSIFVVCLHVIAFHAKLGALGICL